MKRPTYGYFSLFPLLLMLIACGCSNQGKTQLQGEVTYGGQPVALGTITFTPKADGFRAIQTIKDGKFDSGKDFGYSIEVVSISGSGDDAHAVIKITKE